MPAAKVKAKSKAKAKVKSAPGQVEQASAQTAEEMKKELSSLVKICSTFHIQYA